MSSHDRLPEHLRGSRLEPRLPDTDLDVAHDGEYVILYDWPELDAYIRASRDSCVTLGRDGSVR